MTSLSNIKQYQEHNHKEKLIQIKPIELKKQEHVGINHSLSSDQEKIILDQEIQKIRQDLQKIKEEKKKMLESTIIQIKQEKENWEQEKQLFIKQAYQEGFELGFAEGKQAAEKQYETLIDQINDLEVVATKDYHTRLEQSDHVIIDLSMKTAEKIIKEEIATDPKRFLNIVTSAITEIKDQSHISIYVHPNNYELLMKQKGELTSTLDRDTKLSIYIDQKMMENQCLIEHPFGQIDASVDTQLEQIRDVLHQVTMEKNL